MPYDPGFRERKKRDGETEESQKKDERKKKQDSRE